MHVHAEENESPLGNLAGPRQDDCRVVGFLLPVRGALGVCQADLSRA